MLTETSRFNLSVKPYLHGRRSF